MNIIIGWGIAAFSVYTVFRYRPRDAVSIALIAVTAVTGVVSMLSGEPYNTYMLLLTYFFRAVIIICCILQVKREVRQRRVKKIHPVIDITPENRGAKQRNTELNMNIREHGSYII